MPWNVNPERGLGELYRDDPERADALVWGRRGALKGAGLASMGAALGAAIPFAGRMPPGLLPAALAQPAPAGAGAGAQGGPRMIQLEGKAQLILQGERPLNAETPETLLDDDVTPAEKMFVRNNGQVPEAPLDPRAWKIRIDGEVNQSLELTVGELESGRFPLV